MEIILKDNLTCYPFCSYINKCLHLVRTLVRGHYLLREANSLRERSSRKTVSFQEQIMSKDKYPSIFLPLMEAILFIFLQIFSETRAVLKIGEYSLKFHIRSRDVFRPIACERKYLTDYK